MLSKRFRTGCHEDATCFMLYIAPCQQHFECEIRGPDTALPSLNLQLLQLLQEIHLTLGWLCSRDIAYVHASTRT